MDRFAIVGALVLRTVVRRFEGWRPTAIAAGIGVGLTWMTGVLAGGTSAVQGYAAEFAGYDWTTPLRNARYYAGDIATDFLFPVAAPGVFAKAALLVFLVLAAGLIVERRKVA